MGKSKYTIFFLTIINWLPLLYIKLLGMPLDNFFTAMILMAAYYITPVAAIIYTVIAIALMFKRKCSVILGSMLLVVNLIYLLGNMASYLKIVFYAT